MKTCKVVIIRHGERADQFPNHPWNVSRLREERKHDTPLTNRGIQQATRSGQRLSQLNLPFHAVYSSPLTRCLQTAACLAHSLSLPVVIVVNMGKPCTYFRRCVAMKTKAKYPDLTEAESIIKAVHDDVCVGGFIEDDGMSFKQTLVNIARKETSDHKDDAESIILISGHCEAQREMARAAGERKRFPTPYCGISGFRVTVNDEDSISSTSWTMTTKPSEPATNLLEDHVRIPA